MIKMALLGIAFTVSGCAANAEENKMADAGQMELVWGQALEGEDKSYFFSFDPVFGLKDIDSHPIGIDGWDHLTAPDNKTSAYLVVDYGITLEQLSRAIARLEDEGGFRSVVVTVDLPATDQ